MLDDLEEDSFAYRNEFDQTSLAGEGKSILADASFSSGSCSFSGSAVVTVDSSTTTP